MKILLVHNYYQQRGGEDLSFEATANLLEENGCDVTRFTVHNDQLKQRNKLMVAVETIWNRRMRRDLARHVQDLKPDIVHFTNTFPQISPSVYSAIKKTGAAILQDLRNYRILCPGVYFLRDGKVCEDCLGKSVALPGIRHGCYRSSKAGSAVVAAMSATHRMLGTWDTEVDLFLTPTEFAKSKFVEAGFDSARIVVKPNFIDPIPEVGKGEGNHAVFVGRLSPEKGITTMLEAWRKLDLPLELLIVGDGDLRRDVEAAAEQDQRIRFMGWQPHETLLELVGKSKFLVMPSIWYETFGRTIIEAFSVGCPVVGSDLGCMAELIEHEKNGLLFEAGNADRLVERALQMSELRQRLAEDARTTFLKRFTADTNFKMLTNIYSKMMG